MPKKKSKQRDKPPAFQFYPKDWLASPTIRMMSTIGRAAYIDLLATAWDSTPVATLPNRPDDLWRLANVSQDEWDQVREEVLECFDEFPDDNTRLYNARLHRQWIELKEFSEEQAERANQRWKNQAKPDAKKSAKRDADEDADEDAEMVPNGNPFDDEDDAE